MPMLFSPTIGAVISARYWFLWVRCPACRTINAIDLRMLDRHLDAAVTSLIPALSCRSCRPNAPFAELVRLSEQASPTKCGKNIVAACWANERAGRRVSRNARKLAGHRRNRGASMPQYGTGVVQCLYRQVR
jgi:hypothetical protein